MINEIAVHTIEDVVSQLDENLDHIQSSKHQKIQLLGMWYRYLFYGETVRYKYLIFNLNIYKYLCHINQDLYI